MRILIITDRPDFGKEIQNKFLLDGFRYPDYSDKPTNQDLLKLWAMSFINQLEDDLDWCECIVFDQQMSDKVTLFTTIGKALVDRKSYLIYGGGELQDYLNKIKLKSFNVFNNEQFIRDVIRGDVNESDVNSIELTGDDVKDRTQLIMIGACYQACIPLNVKKDRDRLFIDYYADELNTI